MSEFLSIYSEKLSRKSNEICLLKSETAIFFAFYVIFDKKATFYTISE